MPIITDNYTSTIEELGLSGSVSLGNCSKSTVYRWAREINDRLEFQKAHWRVRPDAGERTLTAVPLEPAGKPSNVPPVDRFAALAARADPGSHDYKNLGTLQRLLFVLARKVRTGSVPDPDRQPVLATITAMIAATTLLPPLTRKLDESPGRDAKAILDSMAYMLAEHEKAYEGDRSAIRTCRELLAELNDLLSPETNEQAGETA